MTDPYQPTEPSEATQAADSLTALPSLEDTQSELTTVIEQVGREATAIVPGLSWRWNREPSRGGCMPPFEQTEGALILMPNYVSDTPIPEASWGQILDIARTAAERLGATSTEVFKDEPGSHDVRFYNETGTALRIGTQQAALITGSTGCRLPRTDQ